MTAQIADGPAPPIRRFAVTPTVSEDFAAVFKKLGADWGTGVTIKRATA